jgi:hypothetical protein
VLCELIKQDEEVLFDGVPSPLAFGAKPALIQVVVRDEVLKRLWSEGEAQRRGEKAILVLGMHRSGTSAVAGVASVLGASPPAHLLPAAQDNPSGYWESFGLAGVNDWILNQRGAAWYDCLNFDSGALDKRQRVVALTLIMVGVMSEFGAGLIPLIKDPRLCLLLDLWLPALQALNLPTAVLLVLRHPHEAAASLAARDDLPTTVSLALWLRHMLDAELATRGHPRHVLSYHTLLQNWRQTMAIAGKRATIAWPTHPDTLPDHAARWLDPSLRHHYAAHPSSAADATPLTLWCEEVHGALHGMEHDGSTTEHMERLDRARSRFTAWCHTEGCKLAEGMLRGHPIRKVPMFIPPAEWHRIADNLLDSGAFRVG